MPTALESRSIIHVPDGNAKRPILCFLHGRGESATVDREGREPQLLSRVLTHQAPSWHAQHGSAFIAPFIVVSPQLPSQRRWEASDAAWIDPLIRGLVRDFGGDESRLYLTGFSFGGEGVFQVASGSKLPWAALWAVDPAVQRLPPLPPAATRVFVHYGSWAKQHDTLPGFLRSLELETWSGDVRARRAVSELGKDHVETCVAAYGDARLYDWLLG